jgi:hypothetical protein
LWDRSAVEQWQTYDSLDIMDWMADRTAGKGAKESDIPTYWNKTKSIRPSVLKYRGVDERPKRIALTSYSTYAICPSVRNTGALMKEFDECCYSTTN